VDTAAARPAVLVLRDVAPSAEAGPEATETADSEAPAEPTGSILVPLIAAAASVGVVVVLTLFFVRRLFRSR
jgi:hypothetical protein